MSKDQPTQSDQPEDYARHLVDETDVEGHMPIKRGLQEPGPDEPGAEDTEGHKRQHRGLTEPAPDEPGADDTEGHELKATEDPIEAEGMGRH